ncbi:hypothetical protein GCM10027203_31850 [Nonomuraea fastidiosa]
MARLRLQQRSRRILAEWLGSDRPKEGDSELVIEVLHSIIDGTWRQRWYIEDQPYDGPLMPIQMIWASGTLVVMIRMWPAEDPPEFEVINIFDVTEIPELGVPRSC